MGKKSEPFHNGARHCPRCCPFGVLVNIAGYDLGNLWAFSDLANIIPLLRSTCHFFIEVFAYVPKE